MKEIIDKIKTLKYEVCDLRRKLFPYADAKNISGCSWGGFYLIGDEKSIEELERLRNRSSSVDSYRASFDENLRFEKEKREAAEQKYNDLVDTINAELKK